MTTTTKKLLFWLTLFLAAFLPLRELIAQYTTDYIKFLPDLLIWGFGAGLAIKNRFRFGFRPMDHAFLAFLAAGLVSTLVGGTSLLAWGLQLRSITTMYVYFWILRQVGLERQRFRPVALVLKWVSVALVLFAVAEYLWDKAVLFPRQWVEEMPFVTNMGRTFSLMNNPNTFACFLLGAVFLLWLTRGERIHWTDGLCCGMAFLGVMLSASRTAMLLFVLFLLFLAVRALRGKKWKPLLSVIGLALAAVAVTFALAAVKGEEKIEALDRLDQLTDSVIVDKSNKNGRIYNVKKGLEIFADHPVLGTGFGTFGSAGSLMVTPEHYGEYGLEPTFYADNEYIKVFVEGGAVGTLVFCAFLLLLLEHCRRDWYKLFACICFLFIGLFFNVFEVQVLSFLFYTVLAFADSPGKPNV